MRFLIDTHYLLWAAIRSSRAEPWAKALLANPQNQVLVSAASVYELTSRGYTLLPVTAEVMTRAAHFPSLHKDPFDRIIATQAIDIPS